VRSSCSSYATSETARSEKGILGRLLLAMVVCTLLASVVGVLAFLPNSARGAATLPPNFARSQVVGGLVNPTTMEFAPDGRLFVAEQRGTLRVVKAGGTLATFLNIQFLQQPLRISLLYAHGDKHHPGPQPGDSCHRQW
jgi:hypothetical protein